MSEQRKIYHDVQDVKTAARGGWAGILSQLGADASLLTDKHSACPGCGGNDRFRFDDKGGDGTWLCGGGGDFQSGDGVGLVMHVLGCEWKDAVNKVGDLLGLSGKEFTPKKNHNAGVASAPQAQKVKARDLYNPKLVRQHLGGAEPVDVNFFIERSPIDPRQVTPGEFLEAVFGEGAKALIFTNFYSQGDFAWWCGRGGFRLGDNPETKAVKSALPLNGGKDGVWFLNNPVDLRWVPKPGKAGELGRRTKENVTEFRYLVLESDIGKELRKEGKIKEAIEAEQMWLRYLAAFQDPIRAIYTSGGGSLHALVEVRCESWAHMDGLLKGNPKGKSAGARMGAKAYWAQFGADPAALTPVRLTRLPGCLRGGKRQQLIYLNPHDKCHVERGGVWKRMRIVEMQPVRRAK